VTLDTFSLGGPGPGCSRMRLRRLEVGEIRNGEATALRAHIQGCERCQTTQAELAREREELQRALPFEQFAAGVAEKLAEEQRPVRRLRFLQAAIPLAAAAAVAIIALPLIRDQWNPSILGPTGGRTQPSQTEHNRIKGAAGATVFVKDKGGERELRLGEPVSEKAQLLLSLRPAGQKYAAAALWEKDSVSMLYTGEARPGPLPTAFEWDGHGKAVVVVRFANQPVDATAFVEQLQKNGPSAEGAESENTWVQPIARP
jgi:hypothetical protein